MSLKERSLTHRFPACVDYQFETTRQVIFNVMWKFVDDMTISKTAPSYEGSQLQGAASIATTG